MVKDNIDEGVYLADATTTGVLIGILACKGNGWNIDEKLAIVSEHILEKVINDYKASPKSESDPAIKNILNIYDTYKKDKFDATLEKLDEMYAVFGMGEHYIARKVMISDYISKLVESGQIGGIINHGAGLDPSMLVLSAKYPDLKITEIDREGTIHYKQSIMKEGGFDAKAGLSLDHDYQFLSADFRVETVKDLVKKSQFSNAEKPVFVNIEGVSMYLTPEQNLQMLKDYNETLPKGSIVSIGILEDRYAKATFGTKASQDLHASDVGLHSHYTHEEFVKIANQAGFDVVRYSGYEEIQTKAYEKDIMYQAKKIVGEKGGEAFYVLKSRGKKVSKDDGSIGNKYAVGSYIQTSAPAIAALTESGLQHS